MHGILYWRGKYINIYSIYKKCTVRNGRNGELYMHLMVILCLYHQASTLATMWWKNCFLAGRNLQDVKYILLNNKTHLSQWFFGFPLLGDTKVWIRIQNKYLKRDLQARQIVKSFFRYALSWFSKKQLILWAGISDDVFYWFPNREHKAYKSD